MLINDFIQQNELIDIIDIKFQSNIAAVADSGVSGTYYHTSALIIYREPEKSRLGIEFGEEDDYRIYKRGRHGYLVAVFGLLDRRTKYKKGQRG